MLLCYTHSGFQQLLLGFEKGAVQGRQLTLWYGSISTLITLHTTMQRAEQIAETVRHEIIQEIYQYS